jgi:hypothetical protein
MKEPSVEIEPDGKGLFWDFNCSKAGEIQPMLQP